MKKMEIDHRLYSVMTPTEYSENIDLYNPHTVALEVNGRVLPIRNSMTDGPNAVGVYYDGSCICSKINRPTPEQEDKYSAERVIDLSKPKDIEEVIEKSKAIRDLQSDLMISRDNSNVFCLSIGPDDTPEMRTLKTAINAKQVDKKIYESRFPQFQNDMRLLKGTSITLSKLVTICDGFDISAVLTLRDKDDAVNPMNTELSVDLTDRKVSTDIS